MSNRDQTYGKKVNFGHSTKTQSLKSVRDQYD